MKLKNMLMLALALCLVFSLCACGGSNETLNNTEETPAPSSTQEETQESTNANDGKVTYTVTVVDESGKPVVGALVQLCLEACIPSVTNAEGKATYTVEEADYKVSFVSMPAGYTSDVNEFHFAEGSYELTLTLKAA